MAVGRDEIREKLSLDVRLGERELTGALVSCLTEEILVILTANHRSMILSD